MIAITKYHVCLLTAKDGGWAHWGEWSACTTTCGNGIKARSRDCDSPPASDGGAFCDGHEDEVHRCRVEACGMVSLLKTNNAQHDFFWSLVSISFHFGDYLLNCNCSDIDGGWSSWTTWDCCTQTCGGGKQVRTRRCDAPRPAGEGRVCSGADVDKRDCNTDECGKFITVLNDWLLTNKV